MKLYLLSQSVNEDYDTYDSCVVCAHSPEDAVTIHPDGDIKWSHSPTWAPISDIVCMEIGTANKNQKRGVILASFNAG